MFCLPADLIDLKGSFREKVKCTLDLLATAMKGGGGG